MTLKELREKMARIATNARAKFDEITDDTAEERAAEIEREFDAMMAEHDQLAQRAERQERLEEAEARANAADSRRPGGEGEARGCVPEGEESATYEDAFESYLRFGAASLSAEERGLLADGRFVVPNEQRAQSTLTGGAGGYTIPEGFVPEIDRAMADWGPMWDADIVREYNTASGNPLPWPGLDSTGLRGSQKTENQAVTDDGSSDLVFEQNMMGAFIFDTGMVRIPLELLDDSAFDMADLMDDVFNESLGRTANAALTNGSGTNAPQGILTGADLGHTTAGQDALTGDELLTLQHSVNAAYRRSPKCRWQFNDQTLLAVRKLKDGDGNYLWQMGDVRTGEPDRLLGKPYSINDDMPDIGAGASPIIFGDHGRYVVRKVKGYQLITLRERYAEHFQVGMVGFKRFDGRLLRSAAVKRLQMAG